MKLKVAVDARTVYAPQRRGTGKNLIDLYGALAELHPDWQFLMFYQQESPEDPFLHIPNVRSRRIDIRGDRWNLWQDLRLPGAAWKWGASVLHAPANTAPAIALTPVVVTIHDLIPLEIAPREPSTRRWLRRVGRSARQARHVLTPSEYSRQSLIRCLGVAADKITVNYWAPDRSCRRIESIAAIDAIREKYDIPKESLYVLAFGAQDPRKNTTGIVDAWSRVSPDVRRSAVLLFVGLQPEALRKFGTESTERIGDGSCRLHGFADERDVIPLLTGAAVLCYPSRSEGFGLPILDAFACGTPVITSDTTSLPEVAGDAALLVDPEDVDAIAAALTQVLVSEETRARLRDAGARRVALFSWERCAQTAGAVFEVAARGINKSKET